MCQKHDARTSEKSSTHKKNPTTGGMKGDGEGDDDIRVIEGSC